MKIYVSEKDIKENEQRLFYEKLKKEVLIDIILEFEDSDKKDAEIYEYQNSKIKKLQKENENLKKQLENAIVPEFNTGDIIWAIVSYITDDDEPEDKTVIEHGIVEKIEIDKNQIKYWCDNGRIYWEDECEKLFATEQEAQQKLKELKL